MRRRFVSIIIAALGAATPVAAQRASSTAFSLEQVRSYPYPAELTASSTGARLAWTLNEQGRRNIYVAEGAEFAPRRLTSYQSDDGQELTSVALSADGRFVVYVRGGDHGSNWDDHLPVNVTLNPQGGIVSVAAAINAKGDIVGWSSPNSWGWPRRALQWRRLSTTP
jgi:hypothetical protein